MYPDDKGELTYAGIDVSVAQYIADDMGLSLQVENMAFEYLLTSLGKGDFDMVLAAMEATPDRLENADFSDPYYNDIPPAILVKADKADQFKTLADFAGKSVGAQDAIVVDGGVAQQYAESNPDLVIAGASSELGEASAYCVAVAKGDPKGLLPGINAAIAKLNSENKLQSFIDAANELATKAVDPN